MSSTKALYTIGEVAELFGVDPKTIKRWSDSGKLEARVIRTLGGHRRFDADDVHAALGKHTDRTTNGASA